MIEHQVERLLGNYFHLLLHYTKNATRHMGKLFLLVISIGYERTGLDGIKGTGFWARFWRPELHSVVCKPLEISRKRGYGMGFLTRLDATQT